MDWLALALLLPAAFVAGMVDAVVGGDGLIQIPALFAVLPGVSPGGLFGTNKAASIWGTATASVRYLKRIQLPWATVLPAALSALLCSYVGAMAVSVFPKAWLRPLLLLLLVLVVSHVWRQKQFGQHHAPRFSGLIAMLIALLTGGVIGFYDGFFGPGTGSFLILLFVRVFGFDFLHASAAAKVVNVATNLAALAFFVPHTDWLPWVALGMALCNVAGALLGSRLALRHGNRLVRQVFLLVAGALILRFAWDTIYG